MRRVNPVLCSTVLDLRGVQIQFDFVRAKLLLNSAQARR